ncbi:methyltransferase [Streptomyces sp. OspMP-M43]|uniref:methyltransferase n=1 Tax=Streptomyces sp. OspMP-M43 TaxID=1839781 RepID=UPI00081B6BC2|nr:methyltransferase [Streptomyces sp. OspMP-M43]SCD93145.1 O-methyltransferase [Streptomyces sp. OspMP-M43]
MSPGDLAKRTGTDHDVLHRILHVLCQYGIFEHGPGGTFALAEEFAALRKDHPHSVRNRCILLAETYDDAFGALLNTTRTGRTGFDEVFGVSLYEYLENNPDAEQVFDAAMAELARSAAEAVADWFDFSPVRRVVDIGGGDGTVLSTILTRHPHLEGVCFDRPSVCARSSDRAPAVALAGRLTYQPGDIFESVTAGGDLYLLKNVLHDWPWHSCQRILTSARNAMTSADGPQASGLFPPRLIVLEPLLDCKADSVHVLYQTVISGSGAGDFQTPEDIRRLLAEADLEVISVTKLTSGHHAFECTPRPPASPPSSPAERPEGRLADIPREQGS